MITVTEARGKKTIKNASTCIFSILRFSLFILTTYRTSANIYVIDSFKV